MGIGTPIWPIEGVELDSTGDIVADSLGQRIIDAQAAIVTIDTEVGGIQTDTTAILVDTVAILVDTAALLVDTAAILVDTAAIETETDKIDSAAVDGLTGVEDSLAYMVEKIVQHLHARERWWGAVAVPDETNAIEVNVDRPFAATSGANTWGAAIPILGTADDPTVGFAKFDLHRLLIVDLDDETDAWRLRIISGTGTSADAITAGDWTEIMVQSNAVPGNRAGGTPFNLQMPGQDVGTKCWAQSWNDTNNEVLSFFYGAHGYVG